ncbi:15644_t:CDS:1 [Acaulospora colombiana]|uniref:15644_t:CDS:1 n=1 Tax=Acaulospora colombiana TaxID=27376 RepID=A0ACA9K709_9GLOM|nr:15644_t:CDS:1 [Acaulospora colombiana]
MKVQRKTKGSSPPVVMTQTTRRKSSRLSSINNPNSEVEQFNLSITSGCSTSLSTNNRTQPNLTRSVTLPNLNIDHGNAQNAEAFDDNSINSSEDNYSNIIFNHSEGSSFGQSRQSSVLSVSRDASFYGAEFVRSESRSSTPLILSEISSLQSDISSGLPSRSSSAYQSAFISADQSFAFHDDPNVSRDNIKFDGDSGIQPGSSCLIEDTEINSENEENTEQTRSEDQSQEEIRGFVFEYIPRVWGTIEELWNALVWWLSGMESNYIEPLRNRVLNFNVIRLMCNNSRRNNPSDLGIWLGVLIVGVLLVAVILGLTFFYVGKSSPEVISLDVSSGSHELGQNDELIKAVVANQVRTLCAAEVQKRIPSTNQEMTRYRSNAVPDENVVVMVRQEVQKAVEEMLYTYSQDKLNKADFALSSGGAKIISRLTSPTYEQWPTQWYKVLLASTIGHGITRGKPPVTAIQPDTHVGQCWPFSGQQGQLAVLLSRQVYVTAVTYDHISKKVAMGTTSAPKEIEVWGFVDGDPNVKDTRTDTFPESINGNTINEPGSNILDSNHLRTKNRELKLGSSPSHIFLGQFVYDINGSPIQTFEVNKINKPIRAVILKVNSNWDNPEYTCLYRFRVHGERSDAQN